MRVVGRHTRVVSGLDGSFMADERCQNPRATSRDLAFPARAAYGRHVKLADVIDLEAQLALDEAQPRGALHARDRAIYLGLEPTPVTDAGAVLGWLTALRERFGAPRLGASVTRGQRLVGLVLVVAGLLSGWATAELLLAFSEGGAPVNVGGFLAVAVLAQLVGVAVLLVGLALRPLLPTLSLAGDLNSVVRMLARKLEPSGDRLVRLSGLDAEQLSVAYRRVRTRVGLYSRLERYALLALGQQFFIAFNVGLLLSILRLVVFTDLAFGWSTSLASADAHSVHRLCRLLAAPFGSFFPDAVPSRELIEHTQYFRLDGRFAEASPGTKGDALMARKWWPFLVACTVTYGLLPRVLLGVLFGVQLRAAERRVPLDTPDIQALLGRLRSPEVSTRAMVMRPQVAEPAHDVSQGEAAATGVIELVLYRDLPTPPELLRGPLLDLGFEVRDAHRAGGLDARADEALCLALGQQARPVGVVTEAWEAPDAGFRGFLAGLRGALGPRVPIWVVLVGEGSAQGFGAPTAEDVQVYRDRLTLLEDPYLRVETLQPAVASPRAEARA